jgi:IclR family pca regulon transcriptional regulator
VARVSVPKLIALRVEIGTHFPAAQTSQGKVLLAALPPDQAATALAQPSRSGLPPYIGRSADQLREELAEVRARGWALADEELAPGVRSVAVPVRDGTGTVRAAMNVTVHAAETTTQRLLNDHLPPLLTTAGQISAEWAIWLSRPHVEIGRRGEVGPATA